MVTTALLKMHLTAEQLKAAIKLAALLHTHVIALAHLVLMKQLKTLKTQELFLVVNVLAVLLVV